MYALSNLLLFFILLLCVVRKYYADASLRVRAYVYTEKKHREKLTQIVGMQQAERMRKEKSRKKKEHYEKYILTPFLFFCFSILSAIQTNFMALCFIDPLYFPIKSLIIKTFCMEQKHIICC